MATTAQNASTLFGKLRTSFNSLNDGNFPAGAPQTSVQPQGQPTTPPAMPVPVEPLSTTDQLAVLEEVLNGVEQQAAAAVAAATPVQTVPQTLPAPTQVPVQPQPQSQPQPQPQQVVIPEAVVAVPQPDLGLVAQAAPTAVDQAVAQQQLQQPVSATPAKEAFAGTATMVEAAAVTPVVEAATGVQYVEQEPAPEIPPEVSEYLSHVENHANQQPQEIVIAEPQQQVPLATNYPKQSVIVLPITPSVEQKGKNKGPLESIRWLVEWSYKMMKVFSGRIIYREVDQA